MPVTIPPLGPAPERGLPYRVAVATAAVVAFIALVGGVVGVQLATATSRTSIERRASLLAVMAAARLRETPSDQRGPLSQSMMARVGGIVTLVGPSGGTAAGAHPLELRADDPLITADHARAQVTWSEQGYFVASEVVPNTVERQVVLVAIPLTAGRAAIPKLIAELLSVLLAIGALGVASALVVARDITLDVRAIAQRALVMASGEAAALEPLPIRALDEVGELVAAFNRLQQRFVEELETHKTALARLEDAERRKEVLIATLRHELRTPLNSIIGFAELLLSGVDGDLTETQREDVEVVARSGRHLLDLVDDVLDLSAIASGRFEIETQAVDLVAIAREVVREALGSARRKNVSLSIEAVPNAIVQGDALSLRRAITNLVQNAIEHAGGRVVVEVAIRGQKATVSVRDNGPGITPQELKRLFKPFERGQSRDRAGAGLGLAIALALLELHNGTLGAESEVGKGSTFVATLPLQPTALVQAGFA